ncbi:MAG: glycosyltransferase [Fidelibacterota bacterium]|nr:MAG: glycosyltransferase [Candidatus Neomarinimicrobiota bacterium]
MKLYVIPSWYPSKLNPANGTFFVDWAGTLARASHDIVIIANVMHPFKKLPKYHQLPGKTHQPGLESGLLTYRREAINLRPKLAKKSFQVYKKSLTSQFEQALTEKGRPDIVLVHSSLWAGAALAERLSSEAIPFIVMEHLKAFLLEAGFSDFQKRCVQTTYSRADKIVAVSSTLEKQILKIFPGAQGKTTIIHSPVTKKMMAPVGLDSSTAPDFTFIAVSLLRTEKRIDLLLKAFSRLVQAGKSARLKIVGDGPLRKSLERLARRLNVGNRIDFLGYLTREQVTGELHQSDCLVLPSDVETFGMALVEAMAAGLPVIATSCGGPQDIVTEETGLLVPVNDEIALCQAMQTIMDNYDNYEPEKIRRYVGGKFGEQTYVAALTAVFDELVPGS